ncbi:hypothetical protein BGW36DRAFT_307337 [Talaromyces proteolyticus]|uniref:Uncharacterized protein n=1 Tax=Talaromyces proteolyticus TaxID=1131652 RepID=A0AAD4PV40_9EURO|nr:uncharacterized protein BGW36DRAFT_307337 [Talaromyces proteolyticus]KAH8690191.1 hypothetical protein BGW36DRAFT_307337 [Talaromyces proteolyticus]
MNYKYSFLPSWSYGQGPFQWRFSRMTYFATVIFVTLLVFSLAYVYAEEPPFWPSAQSPPHSSNDHKPPGAPHDDDRPGPDLEYGDGDIPLVKPKDLRVVGVIFYGRRDRSSILECYTRQNLVSNGGWLDQVIWAQNTDNEDDLAWIDTVAAASDGGYKLVRIENKGYGNVYKAAFTERNTIYVKIDDDVVFIEPQAIAKSVMTLISNPQALMISANVVNSPALGWWHYHSDAAHSFKPELIPKNPELATRGNGMWKTSDLPFWDGDASLDFKDFDNFSNFFHVTEDEDIPKHRWLPTSKESDIYSSSIAATDAEGGPHLTKWQIGAQNHYSFFTNLENGELGKYGISKDYGKGTTWSMRNHRLSINFIVMHGADVLDYMDVITAHPHGDDEHQLTVEMPITLNRPVLVESHSIVSHFSYGPQRWLHKTDILERYFNYANENVCPGKSLVDPLSPNMKVPSSLSSASKYPSSPSTSRVRRGYRRTNDIQ